MHIDSSTVSFNISNLILLLKISDIKNASMKLIDELQRASDKPHTALLKKSSLNNHNIYTLSFQTVIKNQSVIIILVFYELTDSCELAPNRRLPFVFLDPYSVLNFVSQLKIRLIH